jgi:hypothetical protein
MGSKVQIFNNLGAGGARGVQSEIIVGGVLGGQAGIPIDLYLFTQGAGIGLICNIEQGSTADYDIEMSGAEPSTPVSMQFWNKHDVLVGKTTNAQSNLAYPVTMVRVFFRALQGIFNFAVIVPDH